MISLTNLAESARTNVIVFDLSDRTQIEITGADRVRFLNGFTSNDIKRLKTGQGCETFITNLKGKVVAHVFVFCNDHSLWLDGTPNQKNAILEHLSKYVLIDDVQITPRNIDHGELFVTGPLSSTLLQLDNPEIAVGAHTTRESGDLSFNVRRVDLLGQPGYLLSIPQHRVETMKNSLTIVGVPEGPRSLFETLRIEAGFPNYGIDITDDNLAQEVGRTKECISFDKGCYLGQETIARIDALGHTNREIRRIRFAGEIVPAPGSVILDETIATEIGMITSAATELAKSQNGQNHHVRALGILKRAVSKAETVVNTIVDGKVICGRVL